LRLKYASNPGAFLNLGDALPAPVRYDAFIVGVGAIVLALLAWAALSKLADAVLMLGVIALLLGRRRDRT